MAIVFGAVQGYLFSSPQGWKEAGTISWACDAMGSHYISKCWAPEHSQNTGSQQSSISSHHASQAFRITGELQHSPMRSSTNEGVAAASKGEFAPLKLGPSIVVDPPVVLAPMAGITNAPYRQLCLAMGAGLCVSEMVVAHLLVKGHEKTNMIAAFGENERLRSIQLYGTDAASLGEATRRLVGEARVDHIDLNFGCPVRKVVSRGGGAAIPEDPRQLASLVGACTAAAEGAKVPVTVKMRMGLREGRPTYVTAGVAAQDAGAAWVALHARSAEQLYAPPVHWEAIAELADRLAIPVLGNGDVLECWDALRLMRQTGAAGVVIGRGCLGRPWLFAELADVFAGRQPEPPPTLGGVVAVAHRHLQDLARWMANDRAAVLQMRKLVPLYLYGFSTAPPLQRRLMQAIALADWEEALAERSFDPEEPFPLDGLRHPRLKGGSPITAPESSATTSQLALAG